MIRFAADENFNGLILRGLLLRKPDLDIVRIQDTPISGADDRALLEWTAQTNRILLTHDVRTITKYAYERIEAGLSMPGVIEVSQQAPLSLAIEHLLIAAEAGKPQDWENKIDYFPMKLSPLLIELFRVRRVVHRRIIFAIQRRQLASRVG